MRQSRNLSEESASSAQEIESIVQELTGNVEISVSKMREVIQNVQKQQECMDDTHTLVELSQNQDTETAKFKIS